MGKNRKSDLRRRPSRRQPKRLFILFCEGDNTEPEYFKALQRYYPTTLVQVQARGGKGAPKTIAKYAAEHARQLGISPKSRRARPRDSFEESDEVWAVFDRDSHDDVEQSILECCNAGVGVAYSNPCFEIWLLLHYKEFHAPIDRWKLSDVLREHCPEYDPNGSKTAPPDIVKDVRTAETRSWRLLTGRWAEGIPFGRPSTTVGMLTRKIKYASEGFV